jgi:hypothetical protein
VGASRVVSPVSPVTPLTPLTPLPVSGAGKPLASRRGNRYALGGTYASGRSRP